MPRPSRDEFVEDYEWFKSFCMTDSRIAQLMRISDAALEKRCQRSGIRRGCSPALTARLEALIKSGREFDALDFPLVFDSQEIGGALNAAVRDRQIMRVRTRTDPIGRNRIGVYRAVSPSDDLPLARCASSAA